MSRNLVKGFYTTAPSEGTRIIDTNELVQARIRENARKAMAVEEFTSGLNPEEIEVTDGEELPEGTEGNVIKANSAELQILKEQVLEEARAEADSIIAEAKAEAMKMVQTAKTEAEVEKNRVYADAKQEGYREGMTRAEAENRAAQEALKEKERELEDFYQEQISQLEPQLVDTITDIYQHIFHVELGSYREVLAHLISTTLRKIDGGREFIIHVSKADYPYVSMQKKQILTGSITGNCNVDVIEDMTVQKGECMIETENGVFDCGLGTQLAELKERLMLLAWTKEE